MDCYKLGIQAALEKLAVSGPLYARALQGAAQRGGGRVAPAALARVEAQPRAVRSSFLSEQARAPGALPQTSGQQSLHNMMEHVPFGGADTGGAGAQDPRQQLMFRSLLGMTGREHAAPGLNQSIIQQFGFPRGHGPGMSSTSPAPPPSTLEATQVQRKRPGLGNADTQLSVS